MSSRATGLQQLIQWLNEYFALHAAAERCQEHKTRREMLLDGRPKLTPESVAQAIQAAARECASVADALCYRPLLSRIHVALVGGRFSRLCPVPPLTPAEEHELNGLANSAGNNPSTELTDRRQYLRDKQELHNLYYENWSAASPPVQADFNALLQMRDDFELRHSVHSTAATPPLPPVPEWVDETSQPKIRLLLRQLWGKTSVSEEELIKVLGYTKADTAAENLKRNVTRTNYVLSKECDRISEQYHVRQVTEGGVLHYSLHKLR